ncbi:class I SAM-dependent DNA methyltransferase [Actinocorallia longicatena]|uniref:Class I SAM-dependent methyltransferase n=1 Tax=Actinocorallia longicatena TaxID=111803 RepID=A0ABP6Q2T6_9ACTN
MTSERGLRHAAAFDSIGARYDEAFPHKDGQLAAGEWLLERLTPGSRVLDAGCGTGLPTAAQITAAGHHLTGVDVSARMIELARENVPGAEFRQADLSAAGLGDGYDAIVAFFVLLMIPLDGIPEALRLLHDRLRPGGLFCLSMVEADLEDVPIAFLGQELIVSAYLREELQELVEAAGFVVEELNVISYAPQTTKAVPEVQLFLNCRRPQG